MGLNNTLAISLENFFPNHVTHTYESDDIHSVEQLYYISRIIYI